MGVDKFFTCETNFYASVNEVVRSAITKLGDPSK
jgi:hypothetical protein